MFKCVLFFMLTFVTSVRRSGTPSMADIGYTNLPGTRGIAGMPIQYDFYAPSPEPSSIPSTAEEREGDSSTRPAPPRGAVLLLHGFGLDRKSLAGHAQRLAAAGAACLLPDVPSLINGGPLVAQAS